MPVAGTRGGISSNGYGFGSGFNIPYVKDGLQLYLDFRPGLSYSGSGTTVRDLSGKGNNFELGTISQGTKVGSYSYTANPGFLSSISTPAWDASGSGSGATMTGPVSTSFNITTDHTLEYVVKPNWTVGQPTTPFFFKAIDDIRMILTHLPWTDGTTYYDVRGCCDANQRIAYTPGTTPTYWNQLRQWSYRTRTTTNPQRQIFNNNVSGVDSGANSTSTLYTWGGPSLMFYDGGPGTAWNGELYSVRLYNRALSDAEMLSNYNISRTLHGIP